MLKIAQLVFRKQIEQLLRDTWHTSFDRGYNMGRRAGLAEAKNRGCVLDGVDIEKEVDQIMKQKGW